MSITAKTTANTKAWDRLFKKLSADQRSVYVGIIGANASQDHGGITMAELAATHEFGSPKMGIPERSFLRSTLNENSQPLKQMAKRVTTAIATQKVNLDQGLEILGQWAANEVKNKITTGDHIPPPLAAETVRRKKSDRPLVDTGRMVNAITHEVGTSGK